MMFVKLYSILNSFTKEEIADFSKFLNSPFFNQNKNIEKLFKVITAYHPHYKSDNLNNDKLHLEIFPGAAVNHGTINNLITKIINLAEKFIVIKAFTNEEFAVNRLLLKEFDSRKLDTLFSATIKKARVEIEEQKIQDEEYYKNLYSLNELEMAFNMKRKPLGKLKNEFEKLPLLIEYLLYQFYFKIYHTHIRLLDAEQHIKLEEQNLWIKELSAKLLETSKTMPPTLLMDIYMKTLKFAEFKEEYNIDETLGQIFDNKDDLPPDKLKLILSPLFNYCKEKEFAGDKSFGLKSLKIIKLMVEKNLILNYDGSLSDHEYVNFVSAAVREKDYAWADHFSNKFKQFVPPARREDAYNYNKAVINYIHGCDEKKRNYFESALVYLSKVNASDFYYKTRIFLLSMNIFYEISEYETLISLIDSFKHYLTAHKNEMPPDLEERYLNFANFLIRLVYLKEKPKLPAALKLKNNIIEKERVEFKKRLIGKTEEIITSLQL